MWMTMIQDPEEIVDLTENNEDFEESILCCFVVGGTSCFWRGGGGTCKI